MPEAEASYNDICLEISNLTKRIVELRAASALARTRELSGIIDQLNRQIQAYGLTAYDLGFLPSERPSKVRVKSKAAPAVLKYQGPHGERWDGGRGPRPGWVKLALAEGRSMSEFETGHPALPVPPA